MPTKKKSSEKAPRGRRPANKKELPAWNFVPIEESVAMLVEKNQPFLLVSAPVRMRCVTDVKSYNYELVLFQTKDRDAPMDCLTMDKKTWADLIRKYDLDLLRQDPVNGLIYGFNDRFRDLSKEEKQIRSTPERRIAELKRIQFSNYPEPVRKKLGEAVEAYQKLLDDKLEAFYERNNILMWDFSRNMPKGQDGEEQDIED